jgi:tetratricopeptide (TPR) repeat protein
LSTYKQAVEANPDSAELWEALAKTMLKKNDYSGSIAAFQKVVSLDPHNSKALVELAKSMFAVGDFESSASIFQEGIQSFDDPEASSELWNRLGDAYLQMKDYDNALAAYQKSNDLHKGSGTQDETGKPLAGTVIISNSENKIEKESFSATVMEPAQAIDDQRDNHIERGSDMNETSAVYDLVTAEEWNRHGNQHLKAGAYNDAIAAYTKAIELSPNASWPYIQNLAYVHYQKGKDRGRQIGNSEEDPDIWEAEETMDARTSHAVPAISIIDEAVTGKGNIKETSKASVSAQMVEPTTVKHENPPCNKSFSGESSEVPSQKKVDGNEVLEKDPLMEEKTLAVDPAGNINPQNSIDWNELGDSYTASRKLDQAVEAYKKAIEMNSRFGAPYLNLGVVYYQQGKYDLATLLLKKSVDLLEKVDDRCAAWNKLGDAYRRQGDYGNALAAYQQGSELSMVSNPVRMNQRAAILESNLAG